LDRDPDLGEETENQQEENACEAPTDIGSDLDPELHRIVIITASSVWILVFSVHIRIIAEEREPSDNRENGEPDQDLSLMLEDHGIKDDGDQGDSEDDQEHLVGLADVSDVLLKVVEADPKNNVVKVLFQTRFMVVGKAKSAEHLK
jgi:hypothetical protein